jgi:hypothetical protein
MVFGGTEDMTVRQRHGAETQISVGKTKLVEQKIFHETEIRRFCKMLHMIVSTDLKGPA